LICKKKKKRRDIERKINTEIKETKKIK